MYYNQRTDFVLNHKLKGWIIEGNNLDPYFEGFTAEMAIANKNRNVDQHDSTHFDIYLMHTF